MLENVKPGTAPAARAFIRRIRNDAKRTYAASVLISYTCEGAPAEETIEYACSYMAAQGVRMQLRAILAGEVSK